MATHQRQDYKFVLWTRQSATLIHSCNPKLHLTYLLRFRPVHLLNIQPAQTAGLQLDSVTANAEVRQWLKEVANERIHGTTQTQPSERLLEEQAQLQAIPAPWRGDIAAARPQAVVGTSVNAVAVRPAVVAAHIEAATPLQHPLAVYEQLLAQCRAVVEVAP
jgi:hypothetical protein